MLRLSTSLIAVALLASCGSKKSESVDAAPVPAEEQKKIETKVPTDASKVAPVSPAPAKLDEIKTTEQKGEVKSETKSETKSDNKSDAPTIAAKPSEPGSLIGSWKTDSSDADEPIYGLNFSTTTVMFSLACPTASGLLTAKTEVAYTADSKVLHISEAGDDSASNDEESCLLFVGKGNVTYSLDGDALNLILNGETRTYTRQK